LTTIAGTVNLGSGALSVATGDSLLVSGGAAAINFSGTITAAQRTQSTSAQNRRHGGLSGLVTDNDNRHPLTSNTGATNNFTEESASAVERTLGSTDWAWSTRYIRRHHQRHAGQYTIINTLTTTTDGAQRREHDHWWERVYGPEHLCEGAPTASF